MKKKLNWQEIVRSGYEEDLGPGDLTGALLPPGARVEARLVAREEGVVAGLAAAEAVFALAGPGVDFQPCREDGDRVRPGEAVACLEGPARDILAGERTALNFLGRLSGIATLAARFVEAVARKEAGVFVYDTRKTTPGLREAEKWAVRAGGGRNHRMGLFDGYLVKDNHLAALVQSGGAADRLSAITALVGAARRDRASGAVTIEVEVESLEEALDASGAGADVIMLDNMNPREAAETVSALREAGFRGEIEVSGGITLENAGRYALAGINRISVGALTHSARGLDFSLEIEPRARGPR